jgi:biotin operon repressor
MTNATKVVHQQENIFTLLKMHDNGRGYVSGLNVESLSRLTGIDRHDVAKTLWGLKKQGLLGFSEKKRGHGGKVEPYRFRITKKGLEAGAEEVRKAEPVELIEEEMVEIPVDFTTDDPAVHKALDGAVVTIRPKLREKDFLKDLALRETDLRLCADLLEDYGFTELAVQVLDKVKLTNDEWNQLRQFMEV